MRCPAAAEPVAPDRLGRAGRIEIAVALTLRHPLAASPRLFVRSFGLRQASLLPGKVEFTYKQPCLHLGLLNLHLNTQQL
jgi:hypothetical protein